MKHYYRLNLFPKSSCEMPAPMESVFKESELNKEEFLKECEEKRKTGNLIFLGIEDWDVREINEKYYKECKEYYK